MLSNELTKEIDAFFEDVSNAEKSHNEYLRVHHDMTRRQEACAKSLKHLRYCYNQFQRDLKSLNNPKQEKESVSPEDAEKLRTIKEKFAEISPKFAEMQRELPASNNGPYLSIILGSNLNISLLNPDDRYRYKQEYESFKLTVTYIIMAMFFLAYMIPFRAMDALCNFLLVWYYCTLTIRESILRVNGSRIKGWLLQTKYQKECLRRLHALGQRYPMDITVEGFTRWMFKGLTFLLPFLIGGYIIQGYCSYYLFNMYMHYDCTEDWQVIALAFLFALITLGNVVTMILVFYRKYAEGASSQFVSKYRHKAV